MTVARDGRPVGAVKIDDILSRVNTAGDQVAAE